MGSLWPSFVALSLLTCLSAPAQSVSGNKLLILVPQARKMPAPTWLKEGVRVTYHSAAASVPANRFYWYKDHNDAWTRGDEVGPAGAGLTQYQVLARSATTVVGVLENYLQDDTSGVTVPAPMGGGIDPAGAGFCWANPQALAKATRYHDKHLRVLQAPYPLSGHTYRSIRFHYTSDRAVSDEVYDLDSGILLLASSVVLSADGSRTNYAQTIFVARRQTQVLAAGAAAPGWAPTTRQVTYRGSIWAEMPDMPRFPLPTTVTMTRVAGGTRFGKYHLTRQTQGVPASTEAVYCGASQVCGEPWMSPAILQAVTDGQVLDKDPHTKVTTRVDSVGRQGGRTVVAITQQGPGFEHQRVYDRTSGKMLFTQASQQVGPAVQVTRLELVR
jgi:hypothetical protein